MFKLFKRRYAATLRSKKLDRQFVEQHDLLHKAMNAKDAETSAQLWDSLLGTSKIMVQCDRLLEALK